MLVLIERGQNTQCINCFYGKSDDLLSIRQVAIMLWLICVRMSVVRITFVESVFIFLIGSYYRVHSLWMQRLFRVI